MEPSTPFSSEKDITLAQVLLEALRMEHFHIEKLIEMEEGSGYSTIQFADERTASAQRAEILVNSLDYLAKN